MEKQKASDVSRELGGYSSSVKGELLSKFFKTGKGEYGEGDILISVSVPDIRSVARQFAALSLSEVEKLLRSKIHEERLVALIVLVNQFEKGNQEKKKKLCHFCINWPGQKTFGTGELL